MTGNLMSGSIHPLDNGRPRVCWVGDVTFPEVYPGDEESCFCIVLIKDVKDMRGVVVRAIVKSQGNGSSDSAIIDACAPIRN